MKYLFLSLVCCVLCWRSVWAQEELEDIVETDFIFADFQLDNRKTGIELDLATRDYENFFIELDVFNEHFAAELSCDIDNELLIGEFWDGPVEVPLVGEEGEKRYFIEDDLCYFNINTLLDLNIRVRFDSHRQIFAVLTAGKHPKTQEIKREARKLMLAKLNAQKESSLEIKDDYKAFTVPVMDLSTNDRWQNNNHSPGLYAQSVFDLLYHQADLQVNHQKSGDVRGRAKLSRKIGWGGDKLHYEMGDIQSARQSLFSVPSRGLGFSLGERNTSGARNSLDLSGYTEPHSEVELYKDDLLIDFQQLDETGFYEFKNVDFQDQSVEYRVRMTKPSGEVVVTHIERPGEHGLTTGEWTPSFVYLDSAQGVFESGKGKSSLLAADVNYALSNEEVLIFGIESKLEEDRESLFHASLEGWQWFDVRTTLNFGYLDSHWLYNVNFNRGLGSHNFNFSSSRLSANKQLSTNHSASWGWGANGYATSFSATQSGAEDSRVRSYSTDLGYTATNWSLSLEGQRSVSESKIGTDTNDNVSVSRSFSAVASTNTAIGNFNLSYQRQLGFSSQKSLNITYSRPFYGINVSTGLRWDLTQKRSSSSIRLSKTFDYFRLNSNIGFSNSSGWSLGFGISLGLFADDPITSVSSKSMRGTSNVIMQPFLDVNGNGIWDKEEIFLPEVSLLERKKKLEKEISENKITLYGVDAYDPKLFTVDDTELDNPFIVPKYRDIRIESHPGGEVSFQVPFQVHYEMEGEIQLIKADKEMAAKVGQVPLHLYRISEKAPKLVKTFYSEPDGFYVLDKLKFGEYRLTVDSAYVEKQEVTCSPCEFEFNTEDAEDHLLFADLITLTAKAEPEASPAP